MKASLRYLGGIAMAAASSLASALPITATGASALPGTSIVVTLDDASTVDLIAATVLVQFDPGRLNYTSSAFGDLFGTGTVLTENLADLATGSVIVAISANDFTSNGSSGSLLEVSFDILSQAPAGPTPVSFRCVPSDPNEPVDAVTDQASADALCFDYAIPLTVANVDVLAPSAQVPLPGSASLALLGLGLMCWTRRKQLK